MKDKGSIVRKLGRKELLPPWKPFIKETCYEVIMGSFAYGVSNMGSDVDVYGVFVPPIDMVFPHAAGHIPGFGPQPKVINVEQKHHIIDEDTGKEYDLALYNIVNYFKLCAENNPNMIDSLFVPERCVVHMDEVGSIFRENRRLFLSREIQKKLSGYAYSQLKKINQTPSENMKSLSFIENSLNIKTKISINTLEEEMKSRGIEYEGFNQSPSREAYSNKKVKRAP